MQTHRRINRNAHLFVGLMCLVVLGELPGACPYRPQVAFVVDHFHSLQMRCGNLNSRRTVHATRDIIDGALIDAKQAAAVDAHDLSDPGMEGAAMERAVVLSAEVEAEGLGSTEKVEEGNQNRTLLEKIRALFRRDKRKADKGDQKASSQRHIDVAVIGSGFAGLSASIEAANFGAERVVIFEKMDKPGGNSVMNAGQIAAVGSPSQAKAGIEDSVELCKKDMLAAGVNLNHPNLLEKMISTSYDTVKWTETEFGVKYRDRVTQMGGHSVPRTLSTENHCGSDIIDPMLKRVAETPNVELELNTKFESFILDGDQDQHERVIGIKVIQGDDEQEVYCDKGVVLASGGFSADVPFRSIQTPAFDDNVMTTNQPGATAEVIKESLKISALPVQLSHIQLGPWTSPDEDGFGLAPFFCIGAGFPYGIIVDPATSKRFVNELGNRYERSMAILAMGHPVICLTDSVGAQHSLEKDLEKLKPTLKEHDSIADMAKEYAMDPEVLKATIYSYNAGVEKGNDEEFGKPLRDDLAPITEFPLYSVRLWPKVHHCMGGLHINEDAQVMHVDGYPIGNLFAAGEVTGGVHGGDRLGSCATLDCIAFGRIAGHNVATFD